MSLFYREYLHFLVELESKYQNLIKVDGIGPQMKKSIDPCKSVETLIWKRPYKFHPSFDKKEIPLFVFTE